MEKNLYDFETLKSRVDQLVENDIIPPLQDFVRIPNLSSNFDPNFLKNGLMEKASMFIVDWCRNYGVKGLEIDMYTQEGKSALVYGEIPASPGVESSMLMYGHIDKQPHLDKDWREGLSATNPVREGDKIYGRGISDDGYAPFTSLAIIKLLQEQGLPHPRIILFFENDEESGSSDIEFWIDKFSARIGNPHLFVC